MVVLYKTKFVGTCFSYLVLVQVLLDLFGMFLQNHNVMEQILNMYSVISQNHLQLVYRIKIDPSMM